MPPPRPPGARQEWPSHFWPLEGLSDPACLAGGPVNLPDSRKRQRRAGEGAWCRWRPCRWGDALQESLCLRPLGGLGVLMCVPVFHYEHVRPRLLRKRSPWGPQLRGCSRPSAFSGNPVCVEGSRSEALTPDTCGDPAHPAGPRACPDKASRGQEGRCFPDRGPARGLGGLCAHSKESQLLSATGPSGGELPITRGKQVLDREPL